MRESASQNHEMKDSTACFVSLSFAGLVVLARSLNPIPSRTRPLNSSAPMVLWLKPWESRSLPGLPRTKQFLFTCHEQTKRRFPSGTRRFFMSGAARKEARLASQICPDRGGCFFTLKLAFAQLAFMRGDSQSAPRAEQNCKEPPARRKVSPGPDRIRTIQT